MILGVDHVALSCDDIFSKASLFEEAGCRIKFVEERLYNPPEKRPFMTLYEPYHSIAYCQAAEGISIELTQHSNPLADGASSYQVLLSGTFSDTVPFNGRLSSALGEVWYEALHHARAEAGLWRPLHAQAWFTSGRAEAGPLRIRALMLQVKSLSVSENFWIKGIGTSLVKRGRTGNGRLWTHIAFSSPVRAWSADLLLVENPGIRHFRNIDEAGFSCLALLSNRMSHDKSIVMSRGATMVSDDFCLNVGGRSLNIALLRGPDGEIVEIIELAT
jgi:hypothetical protein